MGRSERSKPGSRRLPHHFGAAEPAGAGLVGQDFHLRRRTPRVTISPAVRASPSRQSRLPMWVTACGIGCTSIRTLPARFSPGLKFLRLLTLPDFPTGFIYTSFAGIVTTIRCNSTTSAGSARAASSRKLHVVKGRTDATDVLNETALSYRAPLLPGFGIQGDYGLCDFDITKVFHLSGPMIAGRRREALSRQHGKAVDAILEVGKPTGFSRSRTVSLLPFTASIKRLRVLAATLCSFPDRTSTPARITWTSAEPGCLR